MRVHKRHAFRCEPVEIWRRQPKLIVKCPNTVNAHIISKNNDDIWFFRRCGGVEKAD